MLSSSKRLYVLLAAGMVIIVGLITAVVYDSHKHSLLQHEIENLSAANSNMARSLARLDTKGSSVEPYLDALSSLGSENRLILVLHEGDLQLATSGSIWAVNSTREQLLAAIRESSRGDSLITGEMKFVWARAAIPSTSYELVSLQQEHNRGFSQFINDFGVALIVMVVVMGWIVLWVSLTLGTLFRKLSDQNEQLEQQSTELADSRDQALKASEAKSTFLANMSHEIRTPLTAVIGYSESLLASDQTKEERLEAINTINKSSQHVLQIINQILDLSKIEANKLDIEKVMVSPAQLLADVSALMRMQAREKGLSFEVLYKNAIPETIFTDATRLKQILLNLFSNAVKFTSQGHVHIEVSCHPEKQRIRFDIIDSGIGMSREQCSKVFEAFTQADVSTTRQYGGTGLGLTLSKQFAQMLGGDIYVQSEPGQGSRFSVEVNTGKLDNVPFIEQLGKLGYDEERQSQSPQRLYKGSVLLVEDTVVNQRLLGMYARKLGASVEVVSNGKDAVDVALAKPFDLILMDIQMPVMNGLDATRTLRESGYNRPIVALTANVSSEDRFACSEVGCDGFLIKPVERARFNQVVASYLREDSLATESEPVHSTLLEQEPELSDLVYEYIDSLPATLQTIRQAVNEQRWDDLKGLAHQLKGTGGNYGFIGLSELAAKLEFQVINQHRAEVEALISELEAYGKRITDGASSGSGNKITPLHDYS